MADKALALVIEDEPLLMMALLDYIEEAGCEAIPVRDMDAAVELLKARTDIRIVVTDLDVKGSISGLKFAASIRERWPPIELILTSSLPQPPRIADMPVRSVYVDKPFSEKAFVGALRRFAA